MNSLRFLAKGLTLTFQFKGYQRTFGNSAKDLDIKLNLNKILLMCGIGSVGIYSYKKLRPIYNYVKTGELYKEVFIEAIRNGDIENVKFILNKVNNNIVYLKKADNYYPISVARTYNQVEILKYFIDIGVPMNEIMSKLDENEVIRKEIYKYIMNKQK